MKPPQTWFGGMVCVAATLSACRASAPEVTEVARVSSIPDQDAPAQGWSEPIFLWVGPEGEAPSCPPEAPDLVYDGHDGLEVEHSCPSCTCSLPECLLPTGIIVSDIPDCTSYDEPGAELIPFLAPEGWTGECVSPPTVTDSFITLAFQPTRLRPCEPLLGGEPVSSSLRWTTSARACAPHGATGVPPGFSRCVYRGSEVETCPTEFPERRVFHGDATTSLTCTPCTCIPPEISECSIWLFYHYVYYDAPCTGYGGGVYIDFDGSCALYGEPGADLSLVGMSATPITWEPGTCTPQGGEPQGEAVPTEPTTFCCEPPGAP